MRTSVRRLANHIANPATSSSPLRKTLDPDQRVMGDLYVKSEFKAHQNIDNPIHIIGFLTEWQMYAQALEGDEWKEGMLEKDKYEKMSDQQIGQLYELMQAIQNKPDDGSENSGQT